MTHKQTRKVTSWKVPGPDGLQGYWLKIFTSLTERIAYQLDECLQQHRVPEWMTRGRTILIMKDKEAGPVAMNFRPITCLPLMWKLLASVMSEELYKHLETKNLLAEEQKVYRKNA